MNSRDNTTAWFAGSVAELPVEQAVLLNEACDGFEGKWRGGGRPDILAALLELPEPLRPVALRELIQLDVYYRQQRGEFPTADAYAARFPELDPDWLATAIPPNPGHSPRSAVPYFGDYELLGEIGRGGMGVVHRARQTTLDRVVALKMIQPGAFGSPTESRRFRLEVEAVAALDHPNVVPIYEVGEHDGRNYFAMRLVEGGTLASRIQEFAVPVATTRAAARRRQERIAELVRSIAGAVYHSHLRGILHRDLKPGNILLDGAGTPYVTDFGLARRIGKDSDITRPGVVVGTPSYMAPEQARGEKDITTRVDVYGVGAILYHLLTGRPPFRGADYVDTLRMVREQEPERPRRISPLIDRDLETICLACLEKEPGKRYSTADELADELDCWLRGEPIKKRPLGVFGRAVKWVRRNRVLAAATAAVAAALLAGTAISLVYAKQAHSSLTLAESRGAALAATNATLQENLNQRRVQGYPDAIRLARLAWENGDTVAVRAALDRCLPAAGEPDLRGFEWHYLNACLRDSDRLLATHAAPLLTADVSPPLAPDDRVLIASGDKAGVVKITGLPDGREVQTFRCSAREVTCVRFSPDGKFLATCGEDHTVRIWKVADWTEVRRLRGHTQPVTGIAWSPDSTRIASGGRDKVVKVWETATGVNLGTSTFDHMVSGVAWPRGSVLLAGCADNRVRVIDPATGDGLYSFPATEGKALALAAHTAAGVVVSGGDEHLAHVYSIGNRRQFRVMYSAAAISSLTWDPGAHVVAGQSGRLQVWNAYLDATSLHPLRTIRHAGTVRAVCFSPNWAHLVTASEEPAEVRIRFASSILGYSRSRFQGTIPAASPRGDWAAVVYPSRQIKLRGIFTAKPSRILPGHIHGTGEVFFDSRGDRLFSTTDSGAVVAWNTAEETEARVVFGPEVNASTIALSPDGAWVAALNVKGESHFARQNTGEASAVLTGAEGGSSKGAFSADGTTYAAVTNRSVAVWRVGTWDQLAHFRFEQPLDAVALSPDGRLLAVGGQEHGVTLRDVPSGQSLPLLSDHPGHVRHAAFSPDGRTLATAGVDGTVRLWNVATRQELFVLLRNPTESIWWVQFVSPTRLIVGSRPIKNGFCEVLAFPPTDGLQEW